MGSNIHAFENEVNSYLALWLQAGYGQFCTQTVVFAGTGAFDRTYLRILAVSLY